MVTQNQKIVITNLFVWIIAPVLITLMANSGRLPDDTQELVVALLGFGLIGVLSGCALAWVRSRWKSKLEKGLSLAGYVLAFVPAYALGTIGPAIYYTLTHDRSSSWVTNFIWYPLFIGVLGAVPLIVGTLVGFGVATLFRSKNGDSAKDSTVQVTK